MPHVEIAHSDDIVISYTKLFDAIEDVTNRMDPSAGACKSRAYPTKYYKHKHVYLKMLLLTKEHRNAQFTIKLRDQLQSLLVAHLPEDAFLSIHILYADMHYLTDRVSNLSNLC